MKTIFYLCVIGGLVAVVLIYGFFFKHLSETQLIFASAFWFFPLVFGAYGLAAQKILQKPESNKTSKIHKPQNDTAPQPKPAKRHKYRFHRLGQAGSELWALVILSILSLIALTPILIVKKSKSPLIMALVGTLLWLTLYFIFFLAIFPEL